jgi:hypothetical protein
MVMLSVAVKGSRTSTVGFQLACLDVDLVDAVVQQKPLALDGHVDALFVGEGPRHHSDPEDDVARGLFDVSHVEESILWPRHPLDWGDAWVADANDSCAGPLQQLDDAVDQHGCRPHPGLRVR